MPVEVEIICLLDLMSQRSRDTPIRQSRQEALGQPIISRHTAGHPNHKREPTVFPVQGRYAVMFAGEFTACIRHSSGMYAVTHRIKIIVQKFIQLSGKTLNWFHERFLRNVIFTVKG